MKTHLFPVKSPELVQLEQKLKGVSTLKRAEALENRAFFLDQTDKTQQVAVQNFFANLCDKMEVLANREIERLDAKGGLLAGIQKLWIERKFTLSPDEVMARIDDLEGRVALESDPEVKEVALQNLRALRFACQHPVVDDVKETSGRLETIAKMVLKGDSLEPALQNCSPLMLREIHLVAAEEA